METHILDLQPVFTILETPLAAMVMEIHFANSETNFELPSILYMTVGIFLHPPLLQLFKQLYTVI